MVDVNGSEYQELMKQRGLFQIYGADYQEMKWAIEVLERLEQKTIHDYYTEQDHQEFYKAREIISIVNLKLKGNSDETADNHTTTHYIWRTQGDNKTRPSHAANNGKTFSWDNPPETGHPGESYGCRCWAEPTAEGDISIEEQSSQTVTSIVNDVFPAWVRDDFIAHYFHGKGQAVVLSNTGHLQDVIDTAIATIFDRVAKDIFMQARQNGEGDFPYHFFHSYDFSSVMWLFGGGTLDGRGQVYVLEKDGHLIITADIGYSYSDTFTDPFDIGNHIPGEFDIGTPYDIIDAWSTHFEAIIKKDNGTSRFHE
jgi:SPP1 gp7 family putative phage head morphogenesis protein